jgi:hypothetical protein
MANRAPPPEKGDKSVQFISKLVQLTQEKSITWEPTALPGSDDSSLNAVAYKTEVDGKELRLYRARRELSELDPFGILYGGDEKKRVVSILEVLDEFGRAVYAFQDRAGLDDLYESASYSASKVDDLMDSVLRR